MKPIKRAIIACWVMLVACFAIKLFGGNWFEIVCTNEHFLNICDFIENNKIAFHTISFILYVFPTVFIVLAMSRCTKPSQNQLFFVLISLVAIWSTMFLSMTIKSVLETLYLLSCPILIRLWGKNKEKLTSVIKRTWYYGIIGCVISFALQSISLITRNIGMKIISYDVLTTFIMLFDYYIMVFLYYLYTFERNECRNGAFRNYVL
jgi:hypothetical protein